jgi:hypothetical protein
MTGSFISSRTRTTVPSALIGETPLSKSPGVDAGAISFLPEQVEADEPAGAEVGHDPQAVGRRRGSSRAASALW